MKQSVDSWIEYWNHDDFWCSSKMWKINMNLFLQRTEPVVKFRKDDTILNIGCGPGSLEMRLAEKVGSIVALDTSERFVKMCRQNCKIYSNVSAHVLGENYTDLSLCDKSFSLFLCVSVVQYYKDMAEIEKLIRSAQKIAVPGARMLIADLPLKRNFAGFVWDAIGCFLMSAKEGYTIELLRTAYKKYCTKSEYNSFNRAENLLFFTIKDIIALIERMGLKVTVIKHSLSVYANRPSILISF